MLLTPRFGALSPRRWKKRHNKKNEEPETKVRTKPQTNRENKHTFSRGKSKSMKNLHQESTESSQREKFLTKRPSLWQLSSRSHHTRHPQVKPLALERVKAEHKPFRSNYCISSDWETSSSASEFIHLHPNLASPKPRMRSVTSIRTEILADMKQKVLDSQDEKLMEALKTTSGSEYSAFELKLEEETPPNMKNLATWRVKKGEKTDVQISMWKIRTSQTDHLTLSDLQDFERVVIEKSSPTYTFIQTSKTVKCF